MPRGHQYATEDAPLFRFNSDRPHLVAEVARRVYSDHLRASRENETARLEYVLNETAYHEIQRLKNERGPEEEVHDIGWWRSLARSVGEMPEEKKRTILRKLVDTYVDDTAGRFDPRVFKLSTGILPLGLGFLFKTQDLGNLPETLSHLRSGLRHLRDLSQRVIVEGHADTLRKLHRKGTVVVVPTHSSNMDSILMGWALEESGLPPVTYGAGKNLFTNPLTSYFMHNLGAYKVDRRITHPLYKNVLKSYSQVLLERGYHSLFFPGGTRCRSNVVEQSLKLGLLGTAVSAYVSHWQQHGREQPIFIAPVTINYNLVLEAESLIREALRREGRSRYFLENDQFDQLSTVIRFVMNTVKMDAHTVIRFGRPMDPFGNVVDADGNSFDDRGRLLDASDFVRSARTGEVVADVVRDREYTRLCGQRIASEFLESTVLQPANVVAWALFEIIAARFPRFDVFGLLRVAHEEVVERQEVAALVAELLTELRTLADRGVLQLSAYIRDHSLERILDDGLSSLASYHIPAPLVHFGSGLRVDRLDVLYFYGNRVRSYPVDAAGALARAR
jgi:glycerol-3-phosphate O-acyltransferase